MMWIGLAVVCSSGIVILVPFLAYMMWKMRRVRADTIRRSVRHPWKRVADGIEEALSGQGIEFRKEIRGWRGPSYNLAFGTFKQIFHMAQTDLRVFVESRDQRGTGERGPPTEVSIGPVTDMTREHVDTLTGLLDGVFSEWDTTP